MLGVTPEHAPPPCDQIWWSIWSWRLRLLNFWKNLKKFQNGWRALNMLKKLLKAEKFGWKALNIWKTVERQEKLWLEHLKKLWKRKNMFNWGWGQQTTTGVCPEDQWNWMRCMIEGVRPPVACPLKERSLKLNGFESQNTIVCWGETHGLLPQWAACLKNFLWHGCPLRSARHLKC